MDAASAIRTARRQAHLSKRELARRARTSPAAIVEYERGRREPSLRTLARILAAAGSRVDLVVTAELSGAAVAGDRLVEVLELAEHLPRRRRSRRMSFPPLP